MQLLVQQRASALPFPVLLQRAEQRLPVRAEHLSIDRVFRSVEKSQNTYAPTWILFIERMRG